jgi:GTP cyclohydrolase I
MGMSEFKYTQQELDYIEVQNRYNDPEHWSGNKSLIIREKISVHIKELLVLLNQDLDDPNIAGTPMRVANYLWYFLNYDSGNKDVTFPSIQLDQMVVVKDIPAWSLCSHHMLPMRLNVSVGYISGGEVLGLSKIPRIVQTHCHKLQLQERIANDIAEEVRALLNDSKGVGVFVEGEHACMQMRGIESPGKMITSVLFGEFQNHDVKAEFLSLVK